MIAKGGGLGAGVEAKVSVLIVGRILSSEKGIEADVVSMAGQKCRLDVGLVWRCFGRILLCTYFV